MRIDIGALLVHDEDDAFAELRPVLETQGVKTKRARTYAEAKAVLMGLEPPQVIFTESLLVDGSWADVETLGKNANPPSPVIVVSRFVDISLYVDVLERGAFDFIVPPFRGVDIAHVVKGALLSRCRTPSVSHRTTTAKGSEVIQHAQNHPGSRFSAAHAQAGR
jgi:DNA-binding NtrC family response regulator